MAALSILGAISPFLLKFLGFFKQTQMYEIMNNSMFIML